MVERGCWILAKLGLIREVAEDVATLPSRSSHWRRVFPAGREHGLWEAGAGLQPDAELADAVGEVREATAEVAADFSRRLVEGVRQALGPKLAECAACWNERWLRRFPAAAAG